MAGRLRVALAVALLTVASGSMAGDALACGDKFLVAGRGTRYQRPKTARAAAVLIYADPASAAAAGLKSAKLETALKREGHRLTLVESTDQLAAILTGGRFDVVLTSANAANTVERLVRGVRDAAVVVALDAQPRGRSLVEAIDRAVETRDKSLKKTHAIS
jgi:hypothetical protein